MPFCHFEPLFRVFSLFSFHFLGKKFHFFEFSIFFVYVTKKMVKIAHVQNFPVKILCFTKRSQNPVVSEIWTNFTRVGRVANSNIVMKQKNWMSFITPEG